MRYVAAILLIIGIFLCFPTPAVAQDGDWFALYPEDEPSSRDWSVVAISDTRQVLVVTGESASEEDPNVFVSTDGGETWDGAVVGANEFISATMNATGQLILLGENYGSLYLSTNSGETWQDISPHPNGGRWYAAISQNGQIILAADKNHEDGGLYLSENAGTSWTTVFSDEYWDGAAMNQTGEIMLASGGQSHHDGDDSLYRSLDGGENWSSIGTNVASSAMSDTGEVMVVGQCGVEGAQNGVYVSQNAGDSWTTAITPNSNQCWRVTISNSGQKMFAVGRDGVIAYSEDYGETWDEIELDEVSLSSGALSGDGYSFVAAGYDGFLWQFIYDAIPTPTPTPENTSVIGGPRASRAKPPQCHDASPPGTPNLFQIDVNNSQATLYFAPVSGADRYYISYGDGETVDQYGVEFTTGLATGVIGYTINHLMPGQQYSFVVRSGNGCMPGNWGNTMTITTRRSVSGGTSYYKDFLARALTIFPQPVTYIDGQKQVLGANSTIETPNTMVSAQPACQTNSPTTPVKPSESLVETALSNVGGFSLVRAFTQIHQLAALLSNPAQLLLTEPGCSSHTE